MFRINYFKIHTILRKKRTNESCICVSHLVFCVCLFFFFHFAYFECGYIYYFSTRKKTFFCPCFFCIYFFSAILPFVYFAAFSEYSLISFSIWYVPIRYDNNLHIFTVFLLFLLQSSNVMAFFCLFIYFRKQLNGITSTNAQPTRAHTHTIQKHRF